MDRYAMIRDGQDCNHCAISVAPDRNPVELVHHC